MENKIYIENRKVRHEYHIIESIIAGIELKGSEIKSIINGKVSLTDSHCYFKGHELYIKNLVINEPKNSIGYDEKRDKKLLLKKKELVKLNYDLVKGMSIVPLKLFMNKNGFIKVEIILGKGKKLWDKRQDIKERDLKRELNLIK